MGIFSGSSRAADDAAEFCDCHDGFRLGGHMGDCPNDGKVWDRDTQAWIADPYDGKVWDYNAEKWTTKP